MVGVFEVGRTADGEPLKPAEHLLADERDYISGRPE